jgi:23S rRNA (guanosine2251-2'-O)-methyltransferase
MKPPSSSFRGPGGKSPGGGPPRRPGAGPGGGTRAGSFGGPGAAAAAGKGSRTQAPRPAGAKPRHTPTHTPHPAPHTTRLTAPQPARARDDTPPPHAAHTPRPTSRPTNRPAQQGARPQTPSGTIWLYGLHPVAAALANPARRLRRLLVTEEAEATLAGMIQGNFSVQPERMERGRIDHLLGHDVVHQGVALLADPLAPPLLAAVLERPGPLLVLDQITDPRNVGAILRSAAAFGVAGIITQDRHAPEETGALAKAASGALEILPLIRAVNLARTLVALKAAGFWTVGLAADAAPLRGEALRERRVALVLGAEGDGMRRLTRETCDELAGLTMPGTMESLNVSAAAAVALYELTRA